MAIRRIGVGAALDLTGALETSLTFDPPECPDTIAVVGGADRYQVDFPLEAVGVEEGNSQNADRLVPIDKLSYKPANGWSLVDLPYFHQVAAAFRALARKSVLRYYRIKVPVTIPGYDGPDGSVVKVLEQLLPIEDEQVAQAVENGQLANLPASVQGVWYPNLGDMANSAQQLTPAPATGTRRRRRPRSGRLSPRRTRSTPRGA